MLLETAGNPASSKQFFDFFSFFELGGIIKYLMTGSRGNSEFCLPSTSMFSSALPRGTLRVLGKKENSRFLLAPIIEWLLFVQYMFVSYINCTIIVITFGTLSVEAARGLKADFPVLISRTIP